MPWLINAAQLDKFRKSQKSLIILDASWHMPSDNRDAKQEFIDKHITSAQFFDITAFDDPNTTLPHMLISDEKILSEKLSALGIRNDYKIILYDNSLLHTACRALWMFKMFGHDPNLLYVLDGGLPAWEKVGGKMESGETNPSAKIYNTEWQPAHLRTLTMMKQNLQTPTEQVIDLRHPVRFIGGPDIRPGIRAGHIPGSYALPYFTLFDKEGFFLPAEKMRKQLSDLGVDLNSPIITTCGSGMTAAILNCALDIVKYPQHALYDGSWAEWGAETLYSGEKNLEERPVETYLQNLC